MEVIVSNLQILGAIDGLRSQIEALVTAIQSGGLAGNGVGGGGGSHDDSMDIDGAEPTKVKRRRAKSKYNDHMSTELAKLKISEPDIGHRRRFALAVQSWKDILAAGKAEAAAAAEAEAEGDDANVDGGAGSGDVDGGDGDIAAKGVNGDERAICA
jgi:hypothetical protein